MWINYENGWWQFGMDNDELDIETAIDISGWSSDELIEFFNLPDDDTRLKYIYLSQLEKEYSDGH
jgi:hypothetical protein